MAVNPVRIIQACITLLALGLAFWLGGQGARADLADYKTKMAEKTAQVAQAATKASELARKQEQAHALALSAIAQEYEDDKEAAKRDHARLIADLRRGTVRMQDHWTCPSGVPQVGASTGIADEIARLREQGAADLIAAADECDAQVRGLQAVTVRDRQ